MAMINCPECGKEISDKATVCPNCGCPITEDASKIQPVEIASVAIKPKFNKKVLVIIVVAIAIAGIGICLFSANKSAQQAKNKERFIELASLVKLSGLSGAAKCESTYNLIKKVWSDTIHEEYSIETAPYTRTNNKFNKDFNTSLGILFSSDTYKDDVALIESSESELREYLSEMSTISEDCQKCYAAAEAFCKSYYNFVDLATSPSGSLLTFSDSFSAIDSDVMSYYKDLEFELEKLSNNSTK